MDQETQRHRVTAYQPATYCPPGSGCVWCDLYRPVQGGEVNRYLIDGIAADVLDGKSVVYVGYSHEIQGLRDGVAARLVAAGCEPKDKRLSVVSLPNGESVTLCSDPRRVRGISADVLVVDERAHHDLLSDLLPTIADGGELIRL